MKDVRLVVVLVVDVGASIVEVMALEVLEAAMSAAAEEVEVGIGKSAEDEMGSKMPAESVVVAGAVLVEGVVVSISMFCDTAGLDPKLLDAVVEVPLATSTLLTITMSPSTLVTFTSTIVVPKPLEYSKKLYGCLVVPCQVDPPSVLTSRLVTALLALTTCMLNHHWDAPSLLCSCKGVVIGHSTYSQVVSMTPTEVSANT